MKPPYNYTWFLLLLLNNFSNRGFASPHSNISLKSNLWEATTYDEDNHKGLESLVKAVNSEK
jgi:hypothetical protein